MGVAAQHKQEVVLEQSLDKFLGQAIFGRFVVDLDDGIFKADYPFQLFFVHQSPGQKAVHVRQHRHDVQLIGDIFHFLHHPIGVTDVREFQQQQASPLHTELLQLLAVSHPPCQSHLGAEQQRRKFSRLRRGHQPLVSSGATGEVLLHAFVFGIIVRGQHDMLDSLLTQAADHFDRGRHVGRAVVHTG